MAKQSFSVGQVLTANQMLSLQQTAMLGGSATAKTASYTLVAADAGTVVSVNSTSATTITVNTGLFSAGDTVTIQNWGSGAVTVTAGTATVNTAGSLIVPQYDGGVLYFTSASEAIYFDFVQAGAVSPLTTKGDIYVYGTSDTRLGVGANGTTLVADSSEATGLKWQAPSGSAPTSASNTVNTAETTSSFTYTGLTTAQSVTITTGTKALVLISAQIVTQSDFASGMSYAVSGATTIAVTDNVYLCLAGSANFNLRATAVSYLTGLTAGSNTFTCQFRRVGGSGGTDATFSKRNITVIDMGS